MASLRRKIGFVVVMALSAYGMHGQAKPAPAPPPDGTVKKMLDKAKQTQTEGARHADAVNAVQAQPPAAPAAKPQADAKSDSQSGKKKAQDKSSEMSAKEVLSRANASTNHPIGAQTKDKGDPFALPVKPVPANVVPLNLPIGQAGLLVAQVELQGILRMPSGNRAIVRGPGNRVYFLKVNDKIYNGRVTKITEDAIYLEEAVVDPFGKTQMHEIARRIPEGK